MAASTAVSPIAKVALPHQSILACRRTPVSCSDRYAQTVPSRPRGMLTQKIDRQSHSASTPPATRPRNEPARAETMLTPSAMPRCRTLNASVMIAAELAISMAPPIACATRQPISQRAPPPPVNGSSDRMIEQSVKIAKPVL